jgi:hypothetical protein
VRDTHLFKWNRYNSKKKEGDKVARKSKYEEYVKDKLDLIQGWARDGLTLEQIANNLGVSLSSLCNYKNQYEELNEALKRGVDESLYTVENALFKAACGYYYTEEEMTKNGNVVEVTKYAKPNMTACIFYLKNKGNGKWRDRQEYDVNASVSQVIFEGEDDIKD